MNAEATEAKRILDSEVYQKAVEQAENQLMKEWRGEEDAARREQIWHTMQAIPAVTTQLKRIRDRGVVELHKQERA